MQAYINELQLFSISIYYKWYTNEIYRIQLENEFKKSTMINPYTEQVYIVYSKPFPEFDNSLINNKK